MIRISVRRESKSPVQFSDRKNNVFWAYSYVLLSLCYTEQCSSFILCFVTKNVKKFKNI